MKLFLDDVRACPPGWTVCRTAYAAIVALRKGDEYVTEISFDHDLGTELTGNSVAKEIESQVANGTRKVIPKWQVHSSNPVGRANIAETMRSAERLVNLK